MARAMPIRCRWPPENSCGYRRRAAAGSPTASSRPLTFSRELLRAAAEAVRAQRLGEQRLDVLPRVEAAQRVLEHHLHAPAHAAAAARASARRRRCRRRAPAPRWARPAAGSPGPASTCRSRTRRRARTCEPRAMARSTPSTARTWPTVLSKTMPALDREVDLQALDPQQRLASPTGAGGHRAAPRAVAPARDRRVRQRVAAAQLAPRAVVLQRDRAARHLGQAVVLGVVAARGEGAALRPRDRVARRAADRGQRGARGRSPAAGTEASRPPV